MSCPQSAATQPLWCIGRRGCRPFRPPIRLRESSFFSPTRSARSFHRSRRSRGGRQAHTIAAAGSSRLPFHLRLDALSAFFVGSSFRVTALRLFGGLLQRGRDARGSSAPVPRVLVSMVLVLVATTRSLMVAWERWRSIVFLLSRATLPDPPRGFSICCSRHRAIGSCWPRRLQPAALHSFERATAAVLGNLYVPLGFRLRAKHLLPLPAGFLKRSRRRSPVSLHDGVMLKTAISAARLSFTSSATSVGVGRRRARRGAVTASTSHFAAFRPTLAPARVSSSKTSAS